MNFGEALTALKAGSRVARQGWNGKGMWLQLIGADPATRRLAFIDMKTVNGTFVPWLASQADVLAEDWTIVL